MKIWLMGIILLVSRGLQAASPPVIPKDLMQAVQPVSAQEEMKIGRDVAANVAAQFGLSTDESLAEYVNLVGLTVAQFAPKQDVPYRFAVLNSGILNAFAAPGGYIFITQGLLSQLKDEAQLACVLGHEIAHVSQRHVIKEIQKSRMVDAAIPGYAKAQAQKAQWMKQVTDLAVQMLWKGLSREDELEADRLGVEYASKAGYDPSSFKEVLEILKARAQEPDYLKEVKFLLSTHPKPEERLRSIEERLKALPGGEREAERFKSGTQPQK